MTTKNLQTSSKINDIKYFKLDEDKSRNLTGYPQIDKPWLKYYESDATEMKIPEKTMYENLKQSCQEHKNNIAIEYFMTKISYDKLLKRIDKVASSFNKMGVKQGDLVTVMLANTPEHVLSTYALNKLGAVAHFVDLRTSQQELIQKLEDSNSKVVIATDLFLQNLLDVVNETKVEKIIVSSPFDSLPFGIRNVLKLKNKTPKLNEKCITWKNFEKQGDKIGFAMPYLKNYPASIVYTSGTTGKAKGVILTNENFLTQVVQYQKSGLDFKAGEKFFNQVPPFLAFNSIMAMNLPLSLGLHLVMRPNYEPENFAENIIKLKTPHAIAGPADWSNFLTNPKVKTADLSFMKTLASGSAHLDATKKEEIERLLQERGCISRIIEGYGMSEASTAVCTNLPQCNINGSVGIPLPKTTVAVFDSETSQFLKYNEEGELCFSGPGIMKEYYCNDNETDKVLKIHSGKQYLHSGDLGYVTEDGVVYVSGRLKRVIVRHDGFKISPLEIESVIMQNPNVDDCCVVGVFDEEHEFGQIPVVNVVLKNNNDEKVVVEQLIQSCNEKIVPIHLPKKIVLVKELPLTKAGKVDYRLLTKEYEDGNQPKQKIYTL